MSILTPSVRLQLTNEIVTHNTVLLTDLGKGSITREKLLHPQSSKTAEL